MLAFFQCLTLSGGGLGQPERGLRRPPRGNPIFCFSHSEGFLSIFDSLFSTISVTLGPEKKLRPFASQVREVFVIHVGGTRCITSSTDNILKILARITWTVECIRTCILIF